MLTEKIKSWKDRLRDRPGSAKKSPGTLPPPPPDAICRALGIRTLTIDLLAGDGSDRCYYRLRSTDLEQTLVLMQLSGNDAKALAANGYDWITIARILNDYGIFVPRVICTMPDFAALVIEDYGDLMLETKARLLLEKGQMDDLEQLYEQAFSILGAFLKIPLNPDHIWTRRQFDAERLSWELRFFRQQYLEKTIGLHFNGTRAAQFQQEIEALSQFLAGWSACFVHRDFHSRNLMVGPDRLAVIDFQDARIGPAAYDLVSLCFDSYIPLPPASRKEFLQKGIAQIQVAENPRANRSALEEQWRPMLLQRQLKAIGSFGYLTVEKNRGNYLNYVKPALLTLDKELVFDERWPFLSGELPELMQTRLPVEKT